MKKNLATIRTLTTRLAMTLVLLLLTILTASAQMARSTIYNIDACEGGANRIHVRGCAYSPVAENSPLWIYIDVFTDYYCLNQYGNRHLIQTDVLREDWNEDNGITGNHGFDAYIPIANAGIYYVKIYVEEINYYEPTLANSPNTEVTVWNPELVTLSGNMSYTAKDGDTLTGYTEAGRVTIADGASITLSDVTINRGIVCAGTATITLVGTNSVTGNGGNVGIQIGGAGTTLTIRGDGSLTATGDSNCAGIGTSFSSHDITGGNIVIEGGNIRAIGQVHHVSSDLLFTEFGSAGIGTGSINQSSCNSMGNITIKGGSVYATGWYGIGTGEPYSSGRCVVGNIMIYDTIDKVEGSISKAVTYMHDETDVTANAGDFFTTSGNVITPRQFVITYINAVDGEDNVTNTNPTSYNVNTPTFTLTDPTRTGYDFSGWFSDEELNTPATTTITKRSVGDKTFFAAWTALPVVLADGTAYTQTSDAVVPSATYTKTLGSERVGKHQAWLVPFDYTLTAADLKKFTFYKINMIANSPSPSVEATDEMWVFLTRLDAGAVLHANMPYVYKPLQAVTDYTFTTANATLKPKNTNVIAKTETLEDIYSFYATYDNTTATTDDPFYYVNIDGEISYGDAVTVGPYRWIIRKENKFGGTPSYARRMHFFDGDSSVVDPTGISLTSSPSPKGEGSIYTLDGRRLAGNPAKRSVYVSNGRKVVIR